MLLFSVTKSLNSCTNVSIQRYILVEVVWANKTSTLMLASESSSSVTSKAANLCDSSPHSNSCFLVTTGFNSSTKLAIKNFRNFKQNLTEKPSI